MSNIGIMPKRKDIQVQPFLAATVSVEYGLAIMRGGRVITEFDNFYLVNVYTQLKEDWYGFISFTMGKIHTYLKADAQTCNYLRILM